MVSYGELCSALPADKTQRAAHHPQGLKTKAAEAVVAHVGSYRYALRACPGVVEVDRPAKATAGQQSQQMQSQPPPPPAP